MTIAQTILHRLNLNADATEVDVCSAIDSLKSNLEVQTNAAKRPDLDKFVPRDDHDKLVETNKRLQADLDKRHSDDIEAEVDAAVAAGKVTPASKAFYVETCKSEGGLERFRSFVENAPVIGGDTGLDDKQVELNKKGGKGKPTQAEIEACKATGRDPATLYAD